MSVTQQTFSRTNFREFAFTRDAVRAGFRDHVFTTSPALAIFADQTLGDFGATQMRGVGHSTQEGGHAVILPVTLGEHAGADRMSGPFGTHNVAPDDNERFAEGNWKFYSHGLAVSEHDLGINKGDAARANFISHQTKQVMKAVANLIGDDIYSETSPSTAITALPALLSADDEVQGLDGGTYANYNTRGLSDIGTAADTISFTSGSFSNQGIADMRTLFNNASEGLIQPNAFLTDYATYERYEASVQPLERFSGAVAVADASFGSMAFHQKPVLPDRKCNAGYMYAVNAGEDGIQMICLSDFDFDFKEFKPSSTQPVMVSPLLVTCQLVIHNRAYGSNKMTGITD